MSSKKPKILVAVESLNVNDSSGTKGRVALILNMARAGYDLEVLHYSQKEIQLENIPCVWVKERKWGLMYLLSRAQRILYRWFKLNLGRKIDGLFGFSFGFFNDVKSLVRGIKKYNPDDYDMIWTFGKGTSFRPHAAVLRLPAWHSKWYAYVHDPYPQHLYPRPYNFIEAGYREKRLFFKEVSKCAKRMVFPSVLLKDWMMSYYTHIEGKWSIVPHQIADLTHEEVAFPEYFNPNKFNILHAGNLLNLRNPKPVVEAFMLFLKLHPEAEENASLIFLGKNSVFDAYLNQQKNHIPQLYSSDGYVQFEQVHKMQQHASVNVILEANSEISPFLPGKFAHCVAADTPILLVCPYYSECKRLLGPEYPYLYDFTEVEAIADGLAKLYYEWQDNGKSLSLNRPDLERYLSKDHLKEVIDHSEKNDQGSMKIVLVSMHSIHLIRWASQLRDSGHQVYWFDVHNAGLIEKLDWVHQFTGWRYKLSHFPGRYFLKKRLPKVHALLENDVAAAFESMLQKVKPDVVHSFVLYRSCEPILPVMKKYPKIRWIYSAWGNDLYYYRNVPRFEDGIRKVLPHLDYMFADCQRDMKIATEMGFQGKQLGVYPGGGGYHIASYVKYDQPVEERRILLIKGYEQRFGKAINVIKALRSIKDQLTAYKVVVFGADKEFMEAFDQLSGVEFVEVRGSMEHEEVLKLMGASLMYIGNSFSDGMPNTLLEAIIMRAYPIQSNPGGATEEILEDGKNGSLIPDCDDVPAIAALVLKVLNDPSAIADAYRLNAETRKGLEYQKVKEAVTACYAEVETELQGATTDQS